MANALDANPNPNPNPDPDTRSLSLSPVPVAIAGQLYFIQTAAVGIWHASSAATTIRRETTQWKWEWEQQQQQQKGQMSCAKFKGVRPISWQQT